jgi:hypothetical protein
VKAAGGARTVTSQRFIGESFNGRTAPFEGVNVGSSPASPASYDDHQRAAVYAICPGCGLAFYVTNKPINWRCAGCS